MLVSFAFFLNILSGFAFVLAGVLLLVLRPARRGLTAFAGYAIVTGTQQALGNLGSAGTDAAFVVMLSWPFLAITPLMVVLATARYAGRNPMWTAPFVLTAAGGGLILLLDPTSMMLPNGALAAPGLFLWSMPRLVSLGLAVWFLACAFRESPSSELQTEALLLGLAIAPHLAYTAAAVGVFFAVGAGPYYAAAVRVGYVVASISALGGVSCASVVLWRARVPRARLLVALNGSVAVIGLAQFYVIADLTLLGGVLRVVAALFLAYGLLKFGIFDIDMRLKWALERGAMVAAFATVFVLADEGAQLIVSEALGTIAGIGATVLLALAHAPLRRLAHRIAERVFPNIAYTPTYADDRRADVYRVAFQAVAKDGRITEREHEVLEALVKQLGIGAAVRETIEREALAHGPRALTSPSQAGSAPPV